MTESTKRNLAVKMLIDGYGITHISQSIGIDRKELQDLLSRLVE